MSTRILLGVKTAARKAENLPLSSADVTEFGSLNLPELSGPHRPVMGLLYLIVVLEDRCSKYNSRPNDWRCKLTCPSGFQKVDIPRISRQLTQVGGKMVPVAFTPQEIPLVMIPTRG
jgi:hypothetical protein